MKNINTYSTYKKSKVVWLGKVPEHWRIIKSKRILVETSIKGFPDEELLAATQTQGVVPKSVYGKTTVTATKNFETLKLVEKGDFVISLRSFQGGIEYAHYRGIISPAYTILKPQKSIAHKYFRYLLKSKRYISGLTLLVTGIREGQNIDTAKFKDSYLPLPSLSEQTAIANFLDYKLEKIERFISKKKQLLLLSIERRKSITTQIINSKSVKDLKLSVITNLITRPIDRMDYNTFTPIGLYNRGRGIFHKPETLGKDLGDSTFFKIKERDVILSGQFAWEGSVALAKKSDEGCIASHRYPILECNQKFILPEFLFSFFTIPEGHFLLETNSVGAAGRNRPLNPRRLIKEKIPVPSISEQEKLIEIIKSEITLKNVIEKEIDLVEEYKTALIAEVVTGKIDVRDFKVPSTEEPLAMVAEEALNYNKTN